MIPPSAQAQLDMLRRAPRPSAVPAPAKRPRGGRPNPCAMHRHKAATVEAAPQPTPRNHRPGPGRPSTVWQRVESGALTGKLPIGQQLTAAQIGRAVGVHSCTDWSRIALDLSSRSRAVRLYVHTKGTRNHYTVHVR